MRAVRPCLAACRVLPVILWPQPQAMADPDQPGLAAEPREERRHLLPEIFFRHDRREARHPELHMRAIDGIAASPRPRRYLRARAQRKGLLGEFVPLDRIFIDRCHPNAPGLFNFVLVTTAFTLRSKLLRSLA